MLRISLLFALSFIGLTSFATEIQPGKDYEVVSHSPAKLNQPVAVLEFFSYGCPWCYKIETQVNQWVNSKAQSIKFKKVPVIFHKDWEIYAKTYYLIEALHTLPQINTTLFKAVIDEHQSLATPQKMVEFLKVQGVDPSIAENALTLSPSIEMQLKDGAMLMGQYRVQAIPAFVVGGKYKTDLKMAGSETRLFEILNELIKKTQKDLS